MRASECAKQLIRDFEGINLRAYRCPAGVLTIGYGHTGADVEEGDTITRDEAEIILDEDLSHVSQQVEQALDGVEVNQYQHDALCSFVFNVGIGNFRESTLLKRIKQGRMTEAADEFLRWNKAGGQVLDGLTFRRQAERKLFNAIVEDD